jgi:3-methyladenine DNA glycosylase Tag
MSEPATGDVDADGRRRCDWARGQWLASYHDTEWGVPVHDDRRHFELLTLEGAQAGLVIDHLTSCFRYPELADR